MARAKLTALAVERAHRSGEPVLLSDGDGLYLRKQTRDGASWTLRYHFAGRQHWLTLGNYPDMPLAQARIEARQARVLLDKQQDPLVLSSCGAGGGAAEGIVQVAVRGLVSGGSPGARAQAPRRTAPLSRQVPAAEARAPTGV